LELKGLLQKAQLANTSFQKYIAVLEAELAIWHTGGHVDETEWATSAIKGGTHAVAPTPKKSVTSPSATPAGATPTMSRSMTPVNPVVEGLRTEMYSRPPTPTAMLDKDEKEDFLKRENELTDALAERESSLAMAEKLVKELKEELTFLKEQEASLSKVNLFITWYPERNVDKCAYLLAGK
jgi:kinesin family protein 5